MRKIEEDLKLSRLTAGKESTDGEYKKKRVSSASPLSSLSRHWH